MTPRLSLATRAFLFAFIPVCLMLGAIFFTINTAIRWKIKIGLEQSLRRSERLLDAINAEHNRRDVQMMAAVSNDAGLKAAIGLLHEVPYGKKPDPQVVKILQDQLREVARLPDHEFFLLANSEGTPITGFLRTGEEVPLDPDSVSLEMLPLVSFKGTLYETTEVPVNLGYENIGTLLIGRKFDLTPLSGIGYEVLLHNQKVLLTNLPPTMLPDVESQLRTRCGGAASDCEINVGGESFPTVRIERARLGESVQLYKLQSIDAAMHDFIGGLKQDLLLIGAAGLCLLFFFTAFGSLSASKPLTDLINKLNESQRAGQLSPGFSVQSSVTEVNRLGEALNHAAEAILESQAHLEETTLEFVEAMAQALDARDPYTAGHSIRVSVNSTTVAETMALSPEQVETIRIAAKLHDIGKIGVPDAVLQKPGRLTEEEYALIRLHPQIGKKILEKANRFQAYLPIVELHHEDFNGGGYPYGLQGEEIPLGVRIVHVADVYDAITSNRSYRKAMSEEKVSRILTEGSGTMFDPAVLEVFLAILREHKVVQMALETAPVSHV